VSSCFHPSLAHWSPRAFSTSSVLNQVHCFFNKSCIWINSHHTLAAAPSDKTEVAARLHALHAGKIRVTKFEHESVMVLRTVLVQGADTTIMHFHLWLPQEHWCFCWSHAEHCYLNLRLSHQKPCGVTFGVIFADDNGEISPVIQPTNQSRVPSSRPRTDVRPKGKDTISNPEHKVKRKRWVPTPCSITMLHNPTGMW